MTGVEWTRPVTARPPAAPLRIARGLAVRFLDWEDWLTFLLALGAMLGVSRTLEDSGWSSDMPALSLVGLLALLCALLLARSPLPALLAWPLALAAGITTVAWQAMEMVGPGDLAQRADRAYFRFQTWFDVAGSGGISNDPLPFNVMVVGLTWLGVFVFGWSIYRWHNAWLGLVPGGIALFMNLLFIDDSLPLGVFLYVVLGFLLVMRTNLMGLMRRWRAEGVSYPPLVSLTFLHFTLWTVLFLLAASWLAPVGPFAAPSSVSALTERFESLGVHFVRLAGPLRVKKIIPVHDYTAVLPFQGSIDLSDRELFRVRVGDPFIEGPIALRGAVYDEYASGGWKAGPRREVDVPLTLADLEDVGRAGSGERIVPVSVTVSARSVVGSVLFTPGQPIAADVRARAKVLPSRWSAEIQVPGLPDGGAALSDEEVLRRVPPGWLGITVRRDDSGRVRTVRAIPTDGPPDVLVLSPRETLKEGESYNVLGLVQDVSPDDLRATSRIYPAPVRAAYMDLREIPSRIVDLASRTAASRATAYDQAKAIETYLRGFPVDYRIEDTPPGRDAVDYFLFEAKRGYFDYHASAMVVMLRTLGIPSRLAVGFVIDARDFESGSASYVVEAKDAYAWAEVYFSDYGWVEFNPSPDRPPVLRPGDRSDEGGEFSLDLDELRSLSGADEIIEPDFAAGGGTAQLASGGSGPGYALWIAAGSAGFIAALAAAVALGWRQSVAGLPYPQQVWEKTVRLASWAGMPPRPGQTPTGFARSLSRRLHVPDIDLLAAAYNRSRFGHKQPASEERERLAVLWARMRGPLAWDVVRRLWRRS